MEKQFKLTEFSKSTYNNSLPDSTNKLSISHNDLYLVFKELPKSIEFFRLDKVDEKTINTSMEIISIDSNFINKCQLKCVVKKNAVGFKYYYPLKNGENHKVSVKILVKFKDEPTCRSFVAIMPRNLSISTVGNKNENAFTRDSSILDESTISELNDINTTQDAIIGIEKINEELSKAHEILNGTQEVNEEEITQESIEKLLNDPSFIGYVKKVENILLAQISVNDLRS